MMRSRDAVASRNGTRDDRTMFWNRTPTVTAPQTITAAEFDAILADILGPLLSKQGFRQIQRRRWIRNNIGPISHVFDMNPLKGGQLAPAWGVLLDFVPQVIGSTIRKKRKIESTWLDLCYDPIDYTQDSPEWTVDYWHGAKAGRQRAKMLADKALDAAMPWFEKVTTLPQIADEYAAKIARPAVRFGHENYIQEPLSYAFVLARLGRQSESDDVLNRWIERLEVEESVVKRLRKLLPSALPN